jgi:Tfp pilus assembly PilM family ATPase
MALPANPFLTTNHFGVSVSATALRGIAVNKKGQITSFAETPLKVPLSDSNNQQNEIIRDALKDLLTAGRFHSSYAAVTIPEKYAFSREYVLPHVERQEIAEAINWQIEKIFPFKQTDIYIDWKLLSATKTASTVLVTAIQKQFLDQLKDGFEQAGLYPISFEPSASALARLVPQTANKYLIIMELENTGTTATLVTGGISTLTTTTIIDRNTNPQVVLQDMVNSLSNLINRSKKEDSPSQLYQLILTGEKASQPLADLLAKNLKVETQVLSVAKISPAYHLAYMAAISTVEPPDSEKTINLLPTALQEYYAAQIRYTIAKTAIKICCLCIGLAILLNLLGLGSIIASTLNINRSITAEKAKPPTAGSQGLNLVDVQKQAQRFIQLFPQKTTPESSFDLILKQLPAGITLVNITYDAVKQDYALSGLARSRKDILIFKQALDDTGAFSKVTLPLSALENATDYNFLITFKVTPPKK